MTTWSLPCQQGMRTKVQDKGGREQVCVCLCMRECVYVCACSCLRVCVCIYLCVYVSICEGTCRNVNGLLMLCVCVYVRLEWR